MAKAAANNPNDRNQYLIDYWVLIDYFYYCIIYLECLIWYYCGWLG